MEVGTTETQPLPRKLPGTERWRGHSLVSPVASQPHASAPQWLSPAGSQPPWKMGQSQGGTENGWGGGQADPG